jgi:hypothetical protein
MMLQKKKVLVDKEEIREYLVNGYSEHGPETSR